MIPGARSMLLRVALVGLVLVVAGVVAFRVASVPAPGGVASPAAVGSASSPPDAVQPTAAGAVTPGATTQATVPPGTPTPTNGVPPTATPTPTPTVVSYP